jgi:hypothetical protein
LYPSLAASQQDSHLPLQSFVECAFPYGEGESSLVVFEVWMARCLCHDH